MKDNFFMDKSVIIVGPAKYMENKNYEEYVNKFDIVCRIHVKVDKNNNILFTPNTTKRCDVVFSTGAMPNEKMKLEKEDGSYITAVLTNLDSHTKEVLNIYEKNGLKHIIGILYKFRKKNFDKVCNEFKNIIKTKYFINDNLHTGTHAIDFLSKTKAKKIGIIGIDCYKTPQYNGYNLNYDNLSGKAANHNPSNDLEYLRKLVQNDSRIEIDSHLRGILFN